MNGYVTVFYYVPSKGICSAKVALVNSEFDFSCDTPFIILSVLYEDIVYPITKPDSYCALQALVTASGVVANDVQYLPLCQPQDFIQQGSYRFITNI